jgi:hypothetical protein
LDDVDGYGSANNRRHYPADLRQEIVDIFIAHQHKKGEYVVSYLPDEPSCKKM